MTIFSASDPISNQPLLSINGFLISNDAVTPNSIIDIGAGLCRDSTNTFDINLGNWYGEIPLISPGTSIINGFQTAQPGILPNTITYINSALRGIGGLDQGTIAASSLYYIHVIFDASNRLAPNALISLSRTAPLLPFGYSNFRWIGQMATDSSSHFLLGNNYGNQNERLFFYDAPQATAVTAGTSTSAANVNLITLVPNINNLPVWIYSNFTPYAASDTLRLQPGNGTGYPSEIIGQVAAVHVLSKDLVMAQSVVISTISSPVINYILSTGSAAVAIDVAGYQYSL